jgi:hypothetical protein
VTWNIALSRLNYSNVNQKKALIKLNYSNWTRVLFNYLFFNPLINCKYFIFCLVLCHFCLIFCNYSFPVKLLARVKRNEFLHIITRKSAPQLRRRYMLFTRFFDLQPYGYPNNCLYHINSNS